VTARLNLEGRWSVVMIGGEYAQCLQCFAESHIITKDTVQLITCQECQPVHTVLHNDAHISLSCTVYTAHNGSDSTQQNVMNTFD